MTLLPPGVKVHLAFGYTDMRNYAECTIMLSRRRGTRGGRDGAMVLTQHNFLIRRLSAVRLVCRERGSDLAAAIAARSM